VTGRYVEHVQDSRHTSGLNERRDMRHDDERHMWGM
jgi:hypothetical protein